MENIHLIFGHSAAGSLRQALREVGNQEQVVNCWGDYQAGPISIPLDERINWLCDHFYGVCEGDVELRDEYVERTEVFREICLRDDVLKTVWYSKVSASDYCGYLEYLHHSQEHANLTQTVELSSALPKENALSALSAGGALPEYLLKALPSRQHVNDSELSSELAVWSRLQNENAALRVVGVDGLVSSEVSYFDEKIISYVTNEFQNVARVVANTLGYTDMGREFVQGNSDLFYFSRLKELHRQGRIVWQGSPDHMRGAAVRLAS